MKARSKYLCEHSLGTALSAIEIYNKPDFNEREQVFAILMVTAWECILKAKILKDHHNQMRSIWIKDNRGWYKRNRAGQHLTIGLPEALRRCPVPSVVEENVTRLMEVRDAAIHLSANSPALPSLVYALGSASLRNYARLIREWFEVGLGDYNFFILPLAFTYPFKTLSLAEVEREPEEIANLLTLVSQAQEQGRAIDGNFNLVCEIETNFISAKKVTERTDFRAAVRGEGERTILVQRQVRPIDRYRLTFTEMWHKIKTALPTVKQGEVHQVIRQQGVKGNSDYAAYNYRSKAEESRGPTKATPVIYNEDAVRFIIGQLRN